MAYLDNSFLNKNEEEKNKILNQVLDSSNGNNEPPKDKKNVEITTSSELQVNKKNKEEYDQLIEKSKTNLDGYYDKNNIFVKLLLFLLLLFIIGGFIYYMILFSNYR